MNRKQTLSILVCIVVAGTLLRFHKLGEVPPSPDWDEAALGYNAYSILKTGRDEYGEFLPVILRSFDDYKPPLYMYLTVPFVALFDLSVWSVRLPSAIFGVMTIIGMYLMVKTLFDLLGCYTKDQSNHIALLSGALTAISPWHLQFSRIAFEANVGLSLTVWAVYFFLRGVRRSWFLTLSAVFFALSLYAYHSQRVFSPLIVIVMTLIFRKSVLHNPRKLIIPIATGLLIIAPFVLELLDPSSWTRLSGTSSLADTTRLLSKSVEKIVVDTASGNRIGVLLDNRRIVYIRTLMDGYLSHFSLRWLFLTGDNARHHAPGVGLLYWFMLPALLYGLYAVYKKGGKPAQFIFCWIFLAPVAASPTTELPHAIRTLIMLPGLLIVCSVGLSEFWTVLQKNRTIASYAIGSVYAAFAVFSVVYFLHMYFVHQNIEFSKFWQYGYREAVEYARTHYDQYEKIVISQKLEQPHIFFLFYLRYDPERYLAQGGTRSGGFEEVRNSFDKYEFRFIDWPNEVHDGTVLYIGTPFDVHGNVVKYINYLNGEGAIRIAR